MNRQLLLFLLVVGCLSQCSPPCATCTANSTDCSTCILGHYVSGITCLPCTSPCYTCTTTDSNCDSCVAGFKLNGGCVSCDPATFSLDGNVAATCTGCNLECASCEGTAATCTSCNINFGFDVMMHTCVGCGTYQYSLGGTDICSACLSPCKKCSSSSACDSCVYDHFLSGTGCIPCTPGAANADDTASNTCLSCTAPCSQCSITVANCTTCIENYRLSGGNCHQCLTYQYGAGGTAPCQACVSPCLRCFGSVNTCVRCVADHYQTGGLCHPCSNGTYLPSDSSLTSCQNCNSQCYNCTGSPSACITCAVNYFDNLGGCSPCSFGTYSPLGNASCSSCDPSCHGCYGSAAACQDCAVDYQPNATICSKCPFGTYSPQGNFSCLPCHESCSGCTGSATDCLDCAIDYQPNGLICQACVGATFSPLGNTSCSSCDSSCLSCTESAAKCTACADNHQFSPAPTCLPCGTYEYGAGGSSLCATCVAPCKKCSTSTSSCDSCVYDHYLSGTGCIPCTPGAANADDTASNTCLSCTAPCSQCSITVANCTTCIENYRLSGGNCHQCLTYQYGAGGTAPCQACVSPCLRCFGSVNTCVRCVADHYQTGGLCHPCSNGTYLPSDSSLTSCQNCNSQCYNCTGSPSACITCAVNYFDNLGGCSPCSFGTYSPLGNASCSSCDPSCHGCYGSAAACQDCAVDYQPNATICSKCPFGTYSPQGNFSCLPCHESCSGCTGSATDCLDCAIDYQPNGLICQACVGATFSPLGNTSCSSCDSSCLSCTESAAKCTACADNHQFSPAPTCLPCGTYEYGAGGSSLCATCVAPCKKCSTSTSSCDSCVYDHYLSGTGCIPCTPGAANADDTASNTCLSCTAPCSQCSITVANCTTCIENYRLSGGNCHQCLTYQYGAGGTAPCQACVSPCLRCFGSVNTCVRCVADHYQTGGLCHPCSNGTYLPSDSSLTSCQNCNSQCYNCTGSPSACITCAVNYFDNLGGCSPCSFGTYSPLGNASCSSCDPSCHGCYGSAAACQDCAVDYQPNATICSKCPFGTYSPQGNFSCLPCHESCSGCTGSATDCLDCAIDYQPNGLICQACVGATFSPLGNTSCSSCDSSCLSCTESAAKCTACADNHQFSPAPTCLPCGTYEYGAGGSSLCATCVAPCKKCSTSTSSCDSCVYDHFLSTTVCNPCTGSTYLPDDTIATVCLGCHSSCLTCSILPANCTACAQNHQYLPSPTCVLCGTYEYSPGGSATCDPCISPCRQCYGSTTTCTTCVTDFSYSLDSCSLCLSGTYLPDDNSQASCLPCHVSCAVCSGAAADCTSCSINYEFSIKPACISCLTTEYSSGGNSTCALCTSPCYSCYATDTNCTFCINNHELLINSCAQCATHYWSLGQLACASCNVECLNCSGSAAGCVNCAFGYWNSSNTCTICDGSCIGCTTSDYLCIDCADGYFYASNLDGTCYQPCLGNEFGNWNTTRCQACPLTCATCTMSNATKLLTCTSCAFYLSEQYYLLEGTCVNVCPDGRFKSSNASNSNLHTCMICSSNCNTCLTTLNFCTTCGLLGGLQSYIYSDNICYVTCPQNTYAQISTTSCVDCHISCNGCYQSKYSCISCATNYVRIVGSSACSTSCSVGMYPNITAGVCMDCPIGCYECSSSTICSRCTSVTGVQYYLEGTQCKIACSVGYETFDFNHYPVCLACGGNCQTCQGTATYCLTCSGVNKLAYGSNTCQPSCPSNQFDSGNSICLLCDSNCLTCSAVATNCTNCTLQSGLQTYLHSDNKCYSTCPLGFFGQYDTTAYVCSSCDGNCDGCVLSATNCINCATNSYKKIGLSQCTTNCGSGYFGNPNNSDCQVCPIGCAVCSISGSTITCTSCLVVSGVSYYLYNGGCHTKCPLTTDTNHGQYPLSNLTCSQCHAECQTCSGPLSTDCLTCPTSSYLILETGQCNTTGCIDGQYANAGTYYCLACSLACKTCSSASVCTSCGSAVSGSNLYLHSGSCLMSCPVLFYADSTTSTCVGCHGNCYTCFGPAATQCLSCTSGSFEASNSSCISGCNTGYYSNNNVCVLCPVGCKTCLSASNCTSCQDVNGLPYYLNSWQCLRNCPNLTYSDSLNNQCDTCDSSCVTCTTTSTYCLTCSGTLYHVYATKTCEANCPSDEYHPNSSYSCLPCDSKCLTCGLGNATHCLSCGLSTIGLKLFMHTDNYCYQTCPSGFFGNTTTHDCVVCDGSCSGCTLSATNCLNCSGGNYRQIGSNACGSCATGYYGDVATTLCTVCPTGCSKCTSATVCTECKAIAGHNHYLHGTQCLEVCPSTYFGETNGTGSLVCSSCVVPCATCSGSATSCLTCDGSNVLHYGTTTCSAGCPNGEFDGGSGRCLQCSIYCKTCSSLAVCTACNSLGGVGYYLNGSSCIATCPTTYYGQVSNLTCISCNPGCSSCYGPSLTQCYSCKNNGTTDHFLIYGTQTCSPTCLSDQYPDSSTFKCLLCASSCLTCSINSSHCLSCGLSTQGIDLFMSSSGGKCLMNCPSGSWGNVSSHACQSCATGCSVCFGGLLSQCTSCSNASGTPYYLAIGTTTCDTTCPVGSFISASVPLLCQKCSANCITCSLTADNCTSSNCSANYYYLNNSCLSFCPDNYYADPVTRHCLQCTSGCQSCFGSGLDSCTRCSSLANGTNYYLLIYTTTCSPTCYSDEYELNNKCYACPFECSSCSSSTVCTSCQSVNGQAYYLSGTSCVIQCGVAQYGEISTLACSSCATGCGSCFGSGISQCNSCILDVPNSQEYYLIYGTTICNQTCPDSQYANSTSNLCLLCHLSCLTCSGSASQCTSCGQSVGGQTLYLYGSSCLTTCPKGLWGNSTSNQCQACIGGCAACTYYSLSSCSECNNFSATIYYKHIGASICDTGCPDGSFISAAVPNYCQKCSSNCITCSTTSTNCTSSNCSPNYYFFNNSCLSTCLDNYYPDSFTRLCTQCTDGCQLCTAGGLQSCSKCKITTGGVKYYLQTGNNTCDINCNVGEYKEDSSLSCRLCNPVCGACTSYNVCSVCLNVNGVGYYLQGTICTAKCPSNKYGRNSDNICVSCHSACLTCFGGTKDQCYTCHNDGIDNYYLIYGTASCNLTCPSNQYQNSTSYQCLLCSAECKTCSINSTHCLSCGVTASGLVLYLEGGRCSSSCSMGMYRNTVDNLCTACDSACLTCLDGSRNYCYSCGNLSTTQYYLIIGTTICSTSCPVGQYIDAAYPNNCQACSSNCVGCEGAASNCLSNVTGICPSNLFFNNATNSCVLVCPDGTYGDSISRFCESCASGCALCYGSVISKCTKCTSVLGTNYFKQINKDLCVQNCAAGEYGDSSTFLCLSCDPACTMCTSYSTCSSCHSVSGQAYYLSGTSCLSVCPSTHYGNTTSFTCISCSSQCLTCYGQLSTQCHSCKQSGGVDYYLIHGTDICNASCPSNQYSNITSYTCMLCSSECLTCEGSASYCLSCDLSPFQVELYLYNNTCLLNCPNGFWANSVGNTCDSCTQGCLTCTGAGLTNCLTCDNVTGTPYLKEIGATVCGTTCPDRQFISASYPNECQLCASNCITCSGTADNCTNTNCSVNFYYLNNSCLSQCPSTHYYSDSSLRQCQLCATGCLRCFGPSSSECTQCDLVLTTQYYLQIGLTTCLQVCNTGEYPSSLTKKCQLCNSACSSCTSASSCSSCQSVNGLAYYLQVNNCISSCPLGKFGRISDFTCQSCANGCATCFGGTVSQCYTCTVYSSTPYFLEYNTNFCSISCPSNQYKNITSNRCMLCSMQCLTCVDSASNCLTCGMSAFGANLYFHSNQCLLTCPNAFWPNTTAHNCDSCQPACSVCFGSLLTQCTQCGNTTDIYYKDLDSTTCGLTCPDGQYNSSSIPNFCQRCSSTCITCSVTAENCTNVNCSKNYYFLNNSCLSQCPDNYFPNSTQRQCIQCTPGCQSCFGSGLDSCTLCGVLADTTQYYLQIGNNTCGPICNIGEYPDSVTKACKTCSEACATCTAFTTCQSCIRVNGIAYYHSGSSCLFQCLPGQYGQLATLQCLSCAVGCSVCFSSGVTSCTACKQDMVGGMATEFFLVHQTTQCSTVCPSNQYSNTTSHQCLLCNANCLTCISASTTCTSCGFSTVAVAHLYLHNSQCLLNCPQGYYANVTTHQCTLCPTGCQLCSGGSTSQCTKCKTENISNVITPFYLYYNETKCDTSCPQGQYININIPNTCVGCHPGCVSCSSVPTYCTNSICNSGYFYYSANFSCLTTCPNNFYADNSTGRCTQCLLGCQLCYGGVLTACTVCRIDGITPYYKVKDIDECSTTCIAGQFGQLSTLSCQFCSSQCLTCMTTATNCQTCTNISGIPYFNHGSYQCLRVCYAGYYGQLSNNTCVLCWQGCSLCFGGGPSSCTQCQDNNGTSYYLAYGSTTCGTGCPGGEYGIATMNACFKCDVNCFTCSGGAKICTSCSMTSVGLRLYLQNSACVQTCSTGNYQKASDNTCQPCHSGCLQCTGPSLVECSSCTNTTDPSNSSVTLIYYLNIGNTICSLECPLGQFRRAGYPNVCQSCSVQCIGCYSSSTNCTQAHNCTLGYYFYRATNSCLSVCPEGYYSNQTTKFCQPCAGGCFACQSGNLLNCQSCQTDPATLTPYFKQISNDWCVADCAPGEYSVLSDYSCRACYITCVLCKNQSTICQQCRNVSGVNYFYYDNACLAICPDGFYGQASNNTCTPCHPACSLCFGSQATQCDGCRPDTTSNLTAYYYLQHSTTVCSQVCPYGQFAVNSTFTCDLCNMNCQTCVITSTFCLSCGYINSISVVYLYQNKCGINCPDGTWYNSTINNDHHCSSCHQYCSVCTGPTNSQCSECANSTNSSQIYYLALGTTICNYTCPNGEYVDLAVPNLCVACDSKCVRCSISPTNCFQCAFNYFLDQQNNNCTAQCPSGQYNDPVITSNYYYCRVCTPGCSSCTGAGLDLCQSCSNVTNSSGTVIAIYYKDVTYSSCRTSCSLNRYYGNPLNNKCQPCQSGCLSCQKSAGYCFDCQAVNNVPYFKPLTSNNCVTICPNGQYGNITDYACHECIYFTLSGNCVLTCPSGTFPQVTNASKTICQNCSDPSATGNPCNRSYTFSVQTTYTNNGQDFQHKILLPQTLSGNVTVEQLMNNLSVTIQSPSRRLMSGAREDRERLLIQGRLLVVSIPLNVKSLTISADRTVIYITTNAQSTDFSVATVVVDFPANSLISSDGLLFQSTTGTYALSDPIFQQSLYSIFAKNDSYGAQGIIFILLSILLLIFQLIIANRKGYHEIMAFIMLLQVIGISRIKQYPIDFNVYSVLLGYSYYQLPFIPNGFRYLFQAGYYQNSLEPVAFALGSHNSILNLGPIIQLYLFLQLFLCIYYIIKNEKAQHFARMKLYQETLICLWMVIWLYDAALAMISLNLNGILDLTAQYYVSIMIGLLLILFFAIYLLVWVRPFRLFELYKINNVFRVIGLAILPINIYAGLILLDLIELTFFILDVVLYRLEKLRLKVYIIERILTFIAINTSILATNSLMLLVIAGVCIAGIFFIKIYYTAITMKEYLDKKKEEAANAIEVQESDPEQKQVKEDNELIQKLKQEQINQEPSPDKEHDISKSRLIIDSENIFYRETIAHDGPLVSNDLTFDKIEPFQQDSEDHKDSYLPKESESELSSNDMIIFVDPEEYEQKLANKRRGIVPEPKERMLQTNARTGSRAGRRTKRVDGMRTSTGFYKAKGYKKDQIIEEDVEVIKVQRRSDDEEDIISQISEGGWLETNDQRNKMRALQKKTLWKIMEPESKEK